MLLTLFGMLTLAFAIQNLFGCELAILFIDDKLDADTSFVLTIQSLVSFDPKLGDFHRKLTNLVAI